MILSHLKWCPSSHNLFSFTSGLPLLLCLNKHTAFTIIKSISNSLNLTILRVITTLRKLSLFSIMHLITISSTECLETKWKYITWLRDRNQSMSKCQTLRVWLVQAICQRALTANYRSKNIVVWLRAITPLWTSNESSVLLRLPIIQDLRLWIAEVCQTFLVPCCFS